MAPYFKTKNDGEAADGEGTAGDSGTASRYLSPTSTNSSNKKTAQD